MRRWVRYEAPVMVCVEIDETGGGVVNVVLGNEHDDIALARDHRGHFLVYDENMDRVETDEPTEGRALTIAEHREWPAQLDWEEGPTRCATPSSTNPPILTTPKTKTTWNSSLSRSATPPSSTTPLNQKPPAGVSPADRALVMPSSDLAGWDSYPSTGPSSVKFLISESLTVLRA